MKIAKEHSPPMFVLVPAAFRAIMEDCVSGSVLMVTVPKVRVGACPWLHSAERPLPHPRHLPSVEAQCSRASPIR